MNVFISYRRGDTPLAAHALRYALRAGGHDAFVDTGNIGAGERFRQAIANAVANANVMFALIGPNFEPRRLHEAASVIAFEWQRARFHGITVVPVLVEEGKLPDDKAMPESLRWLRWHNVLALRRASLTADIDACVAAVPALAATPRRAARVLWVDDHPSNNESERERLRPHGIVFDCVVSTKEALHQLASESYDLVITDLGRRGSSDRSSTAGADFLDQPIVRDGGPPVIVYAGAWAQIRREQLMQRGALDATADRQRLIDKVLDILGRGTPPVGELTR